MTRMTAFLAGVGLAVSATALSAQGMMDTDGDGQVTFGEASAAMPDLTEENFVAIDTDGDGVLSADEVSAAQQQGLLPAE
ncbi:hypothetical protein OCGS_0058 [Oceaniovalibus guishaninsula JLT2003]|uniref:EF-hand domain-containing protein n=1 Tax=Oceaniovalibus guishaninsula JLT2003 TaxID=1231392 RepID=K2HHC2_9RHOB|nr:hypothetical protein [Oceaniovalibus guishaninsula]EKE45832.1 hypothetical protein OCGS_0058 [Oceaniovalibus guishaninsula JLT2003]